MIDFVTWSLLVVGVTYAVTCSFVFALPRMLIARLGLFTKYFIYCPWCVSFWAGAASETLYTNERLWSAAWFGSLVVAGFVAMGLISLLKAAMADFLTPPFENEQGQEITLIAPRAEEIEAMAREQPALVLFSGATDVKCPHKWYKLGDEDRCLTCGVTKS